MTGFIKGLFGSKPKAEAAEAPKAEKPAAPANDKSGFFYLDADSAQSLGDVNYMRTPKSVKKSFPKVEGGKKENVERVDIISAMEKKSASEKPVSNFSSAPASESSASANVVKSERRRADSSMDAFRKMARDMKKS